MKSSLLYCAFVVMAFAAAGLAVFHENALATLTSQSQTESFKSGGLRSFEVVPLETVSETSANASIGDLNGDGYPDIVLAKGRHWEVPSRIFFGDGKGNFTPGPAVGLFLLKLLDGVLGTGKTGHPLGRAPADPGKFGRTNACCCGH